MVSRFVTAVYVGICVGSTGAALYAIGWLFQRTPLLLPVMVLVGGALFLGLLVLGVSGLLRGLEPHDAEQERKC